MRFSRVLRQRQTEAERALWQCLRGHRLFGLKFRRQKILGPYIVISSAVSGCWRSSWMAGSMWIRRPIGCGMPGWRAGRQGTAVLAVILRAVESWGEGGTKEPAARVVGGFCREMALPSSSPDFPTLPQSQCNHSVTNPDRFVTRDAERLNRLEALQAQTCSE
ncbi:TPA: DUF559 domain-containing protein [Pseudomonas aeruginosa]